MASIIKTCRDLLLIACGENIGVFDLRCPGNVSILSLREICPVGGGSVPVQDKAKKQQQIKDDSKEEKDKDESKSSLNRVLAVEVSSDGQYIAVCDDHKFLHVFHQQGSEAGHGCWDIASSRLVSRRCTVVRFTSDLRSILVADKSGDVFSFPLHSTPAPVSSSSVPPPASDNGASNQPPPPPQPGATEAVDVEDEDGENPRNDDDNDGDDDDDGDGCGGKLVLGHLSMLLDMILIADDRYVVTADRDEKVRISCYPDGYNIHTYCLGHTAFVISLACDESRKILFSGSGDATIGMWTYSGRLVEQRNCLDDFPQLMGNDNEEQDEKGGADDVTKQADDVTRQAVQEIVFCSKCSLLFAALYRSPHILMYRVHTTTSSSESVSSLRPVRLLTSNNPEAGDVISLSVQDCVLWVLRQAGLPKLQMEAVGVSVLDEEVVTAPVDDVDSATSKVLQSLANHPELLTAPQPWQDPIPSLWKSQIDGYVQEYLERKRQRMEGEGRKPRQGYKRSKKGNRVPVKTDR